MSSKRKSPPNKLEENLSTAPANSSESTTNIKSENTLESGVGGITTGGGASSMVELFKDHHQQDFKESKEDASYSLILNNLKHRYSKHTSRKNISSEDLDTKMDDGSSNGNNICTEEVLEKHKFHNVNNRRNMDSDKEDDLSDDFGSCYSRTSSEENELEERGGINKKQKRRKGKLNGKCLNNNNNNTKGTNNNVMSGGSLRHPRRQHDEESTSGESSTKSPTLYHQHSFNNSNNNEQQLLLHQQSQMHYSPTGDGNLAQKMNKKSMDNVLKKLSSKLNSSGSSSCGSHESNNNMIESSFMSPSFPIENR